MNKNTIFGFIAIGAIMFGFSWYQSSKMKDQMEQEQQAQIEQAANTIIDAEQQRIAEEQADAVETVPVTVQEMPKLPFNDEQLNAAYNDPKLNDGLYPQFDTLSNDVMEIVFTTKGAQPYSVRFKNYTAYNPQEPEQPKDLYFLRPGASDYNVSLELAGPVSGTKDVLNTRDFFFQLDQEQSKDSVVVMKLPFNGGYVQQK